MNDIEWFETQGDNHPLIGRFKKSGVWYAEVVINDEDRIVGNGKTMAEAIAACRANSASRAAI